MKWLRLCVLTLGTICTITPLLPYWQVTSQPLPDGTNELRRKFTLGIPSSPLLILDEAETKPVRLIRPDGGVTSQGGGFRRTAGLDLFSWSTLLLVLGVMFLEADRRWLKKQVAGSEYKAGSR